MSAIVTEHFRRNNAATFLADIANAANNYYLGIGKSDKWAADESIAAVVPSINGTNGEERDILSNLITCIQVTTGNTHIAIPNIIFETGRKYKAYKPNDSSCFYPTIGADTVYPCYATLSGRVYLCLSNNAGAAATVLPTSALNYSAVTGADNYIWVLIDTDATNFNTDQFISIRSTPNNTNSTQILNDGGGLLYGFTILNGGSGYSNQTVTFNARQSGSATPVVVSNVVVTTTGGVITGVALPSGYDYTGSNAKNILGGVFIGLTGGTGAVIVPNIAPAEGFAYNPSRTLPAFYAAISINAVDNISSDGLFIPFRQISLIKNLEITAGTANPSTLAALRYLVLSGAPAYSTNTGEVITFTNSSRAFYDTYAVVGGQHRVYFHQNSITGTGIVPAGTSTYTTGANSVSYTAVNDNEYISNSGDVVFTENRLPITRQSGQTEEIKIIIQF